MIHIKRSMEKMIVILRRISTRFALGFLSVLFLCNSLYGQCDDGYLEIDEDCYWEKDIFFLQSFIDGSEDFLDIDMDALSLIHISEPTRPY